MAQDRHARELRRGARAFQLILIFYAFSREVGPLKRRLKERAPLAEPGLRGFESRAGERRIVFVATGIGAERARETARIALDRFAAPELVLGTGVAGALSAGLSPGDIVLAERIVAAPAEGRGPEPAFEVAPDALTHCEQVLQQASLAFARGGLLTSRRVLANAHAKLRAKEQTGAIAVDMESAALAAEAARRGLRFAVVRTVMDALGDEVFGAELADEHGRVRALAATGYLMKNPSAIVQLPRMMRNLGHATRSLAQAIEAFTHAAPFPR